MPNFRSLFREPDPTDAQGKAAQAARQRAIADLLSQQAMQQPTMQPAPGGIMPSYGVGQGLTQLGQALMARRAGNKATTSEGSANEARRQAQAAALSGMTNPPNMVELPERQNPYARAQSALEADVDPNVVGSYLKTQVPEVGAEPASLAGYRQAKAEGYAGTYTDYKKEFEGREANVPAALQVWKLYQSLSPEDRAAFVESQRNVPIETVNQVPTRVLAGGAQQPLSSLGSEASAVQTINDAKAEGTETGQARGTAIANLPVIQSTTRAALETVDKMLKHPGIETATGLSGTLDPRNYIPGTAARDFQTLRNQAQGQVFLDAYQSLKGGGVITEIEGLKAEQAKARMDTAQSDEEFRAALNDYANALRRGLQLAEQRAGYSTGGGFGSPNVAPGAPSAPGTVNWADLQ